MTLKKELIARIKANGPISIADFMTEALLHPTKGYYTSRNPFGSQGDFVTAPEISQMFGEIIGLSLAQSWLDQGAPSSFVLAELGPGRGTLMSDILRATHSIKGFNQAARLFLVEASANLKNIQKTILNRFNPTWISKIDDLPQAPLWLVANEFFDALPIQQFERSNDGWKERHIGLIEGSLGFGVSLPNYRLDLAHRLEDTKGGDIVEICTAAKNIINYVGNQITSKGGCALIFDYGDWRSQGDTLQAIQNHKHVNPLDEPGAADLTAHVDFEALAQSSTPAAHTRITPQGIYLERLGITARANQLAGRLSGAALVSHIAAHKRLTHSEEMGTIFKVLGIFPPNSKIPPGLTK